MNQEERRILFAVKDIKAGEEFTSENARSIGPRYGLPSKYYSSLIGRKSKRDIGYGEPLGEEDI